MQTIYKYTLELVDEFTLDLPADARSLHVAMQYGQPRLWALVSPDAPTVTRTFHFRGTGHPVPLHSRYIGTVLTFNESLVFHLFEAQ